MEPLENYVSAARILNVKTSTLRAWVSQRRIPFVRVGRCIRFDPADLTAYIEARKVLPKGDSVRV